MPTLLHRRLQALEKAKIRRDVPALVTMVKPLSEADEQIAAAYRDLGTVVVLISAVDAML
jgi:hypothetical protein